MSVLSNPKILPTFMVIVNSLISLSYFAQKDFRHGIYWVACAVATAAVTY